MNIKHCNEYNTKIIFNWTFFNKQQNTFVEMLWYQNEVDNIKILNDTLNNFLNEIIFATNHQIKNCISYFYFFNNHRIYTGALNKLSIQQILCKDSFFLLYVIINLLYNNIIDWYRVSLELLKIWLMVT